MIEDKFCDAVEKHEVVGIGFGPANLSLAIALREFQQVKGTSLGASSMFIEKESQFGWHSDMLIDGASMQVSFLKDLVTMRNPTSPFSFVAYLHEHGRLADFINNAALMPYRKDFHCYLRWAADKLSDAVQYGARVLAIEPVFREGVAETLDVKVEADGRERILRSRNLIVGTGMSPHLPAGVKTSARVWHSSGLLARLRELGPVGRASFVVVGAGQSSAEVVGHLHRKYPEATVHAVFSRYGYSVADDSPFVNKIFDPAAVDEFWQAPEQVKESLLGYHAGTNYGVVDLDLSRDLYGIAYQEKLDGNPRLQVHHVSRVVRAEEAGEGVDIDIEFLPDSRVDRLRADVLIYATGYRANDPMDVLGDLGVHCKRDDQGRLVLGRDYQVITSDALQFGLYVHGAAAEHTHGLTASLLSTMAVRAGEITRSIADHVL